MILLVRGATRIRAREIRRRIKDAEVLWKYDLEDEEVAYNEYCYGI